VSPLLRRRSDVDPFDPPEPVGSGSRVKGRVASFDLRRGASPDCAGGGWAAEAFGAGSDADSDPECGQGTGPVSVRPPSAGCPPPVLVPSARSDPGFGASPAPEDAEPVVALSPACGEGAPVLSAVSGRFSVLAPEPGVLPSGAAPPACRPPSPAACAEPGRGGRSTAVVGRSERATKGRGCADPALSLRSGCPARS